MLQMKNVIQSMADGGEEKGEWRHYMFVYLFTTVTVSVGHPWRWYFITRRREGCQLYIYSMMFVAEVRLAFPNSFTSPFIFWKGGGIDLLTFTSYTDAKKTFKNSWINFVSLCCREAITNTVVLFSPKAFIVFYKKKCFPDLPPLLIKSMHKATTYKWAARKMNWSINLLIKEHGKNTTVHCGRHTAQYALCTVCNTRYACF